MNNTLLQFKVRERLNKAASKDYPNLDCFRIAEAFNKAQLDWVREKVAEGEATKQTVEDIQILLKPKDLSGTNHPVYFETEKLPGDLLSISRVTVRATKKECPEAPIRSVLIENANSDDYMLDANLRPSFAWREAFHTFQGNRIHVYTNSDFSVTNCKILYYRKPQSISVGGCEDEHGNGVTDVECEFKDDIVEMLISRTCSIIAGDIENFNQVQLHRT